MEPILEAKKYSAMTEKELLAEAERLASHEDKTVAGFGRTLKKCVLNKFIDLNEFFTAVSAILFVGGPVLSICIGAIIGALISINLDVQKLRKFYGIFLAIIAIHEIYTLIKQYKQNKKRHTKIS